MVELTLPLAAQPTDFLTIKALGTFGGASLATWAVGNTIRYVIKRDWRLIPFAAAFGFSYLAAQITGDPDSLGDWGLVALNACLLFCTAVGINEMAVSGASDQGGVRVHGTRPIRWLQTWYPASNE